MPTIPLIGISIWTIAKGAVVVFLLLYIVFSVVVLRQARLMTETLEVGFEKQINILAIAHLVFAVVVFILALVIL